MNITSIGTSYTPLKSSQNFGKLYIEDKKLGTKEILDELSSESDEYRKTIDYIKNSNETHIWVKNDGTVLYKKSKDNAKVDAYDENWQNNWECLFSFRERLVYAIDEIKRYQWEKIEKFSKGLIGK